MKKPKQKDDPVIVSLDYQTETLNERIFMLSHNRDALVVKRADLLTPYEIGDKVQLRNGRRAQITQIGASFFPLYGRRIRKDGSLGKDEMNIIDSDIIEVLSE